jgi:uncharacterized protein (TIGR02466 family)
MNEFFYRFPGPFVYISEIENHSRWKEHVKETVENWQDSQPSSFLEKGSNLSTSYHSKNPVKEFLEPEFLKSVVWGPLDKALEKADLAAHPAKSHLQNIWFNDYPQGGNMGAHVHSNSEWSGIYIVEMSQPNPTFFMYNSTSNSPAFCTSLNTEENAKEGNVIIFPSHLVHWVHTTCEERLTVSFNVGSTYSR